MADHLPKRFDVLAYEPQYASRKPAKAMDNPHLHRQHAGGVLFDAVKFKLDKLDAVIMRQSENYDDYDYHEAERRINLEIPDLLYRAIELQPWSFHLHDQLIRFLGRLTRYDDIRRHLDQMMQMALHGSREDPSRVARNRGRWVEARIRGFESRAGRAAKRSAASVPVTEAESAGAVLPPGAAPR